MLVKLTRISQRERRKVMHQIRMTLFGSTLFLFELTDHKTSVCNQTMQKITSVGGQPKKTERERERGREGERDEDGCMYDVF